MALHADRRRAARRGRARRSRPPLPGRRLDPARDRQRDAPRRGRRPAPGGRPRARVGRPDDRRRPAAARRPTSTAMRDAIAGAARARPGRRRRQGLDRQPGRRWRAPAAGSPPRPWRSCEVAAHDAPTPRHAVRRDARRSSRSSPATSGIYSCGPTVYGPAHIGNFRSFLFADLLVRYLRYRGLRVTWVMNLTDVDDKIIKGAAAAGEPIGELTGPLHRAVPGRRGRAADDAARRAAAGDRAHRPRWSTLIGDAARAAATPTGPTTARSSSGSPRGRRTAGSPASTSRTSCGRRARRGRRVRQGRRPRLRALEGPEAGEPSWDTAIGPGRPGWHIECSAMSMAAPRPDRSTSTPAASTSSSRTTRTRSPRARPRRASRSCATWLHCAHLQMGGAKMAKSTGNIARVADLLAAGRLAARPALRADLGPLPGGLNYSRRVAGGRGCGGRAARRGRSPRCAATARSAPTTRRSPAALDAGPRPAFEAALDDDLNVSPALAAVFDLVRDLNRRIDARGLSTADAGRALAAASRAFDTVLGVRPDDVEDLEPGAARRCSTPGPSRAGARDWAASDRLRDELLPARGIAVEDTRDGQRWRRIEAVTSCLTASRGAMPAVPVDRRRRGTRGPGRRGPGRAGGSGTPAAPAARRTARTGGRAARSAGRDRAASADRRAGGARPGGAAAAPADLGGRAREGGRSRPRTRRTRQGRAQGFGGGPRPFVPRRVPWTAQRRTARSRVAQAGLVPATRHGRGEGPGGGRQGQAPDRGQRPRSFGAATRPVRSARDRSPGSGLRATGRRREEPFGSAGHRDRARGHQARRDGRDDRRAPGRDDRIDRPTRSSAAAPAGRPGGRPGGLGFRPRRSDDGPPRPGRAVPRDAVWARRSTRTSRGGRTDRRAVAARRWPRRPTDRRRRGGRGRSPAGRGGVRRSPHRRIGCSSPRSAARRSSRSSCTRRACGSRSSRSRAAR